MSEARRVSVVEGKAAGSPWYAWLVLIALLAGVGFVAVRNPRGVAFGAALVAVFGALGVLSTRYARVQAAVDSVFRQYMRASVILGVVAFSAAAARALAEIVARASIAVAVVLLGLWFALFCVGVFSLSTEQRRSRVWRRLRPLGGVAPFVYAFVLAEIAIILFATAAFVLADHGVVRFGESRSSPALISQPSDALDFFTWQLLDSIPVLDVTKTLRWEEPLGYKDGKVGLLVLVFKVVCIAPILAAFTFFWRARRDRDPLSASGVTG